MTQSGRYASLAHHLAVDQFKGVGRHSNFASIRVIEEDDQTDHGACEERDDSTKQQMRSKPKVEHPDQNHVDQGTDGHRVPHDGWNPGGDIEKAQPTRLKEIIELAERRIVESLVSFRLRLNCGQP